jgi:hypothetical protein
MEIKIEVSPYDEKEGIKYLWENGFEISVSNINNETVIMANKAGLLSLANHLLTLAQDGVPINSHLHYDHYNSLEEGSKELVIQKI